jgi:PAS domain S-box-containing protein
VTSDALEISIPSDFLQKWQRLVDLLAKTMSVPSAVVTKMEPPDCTRYEVIVSSASKGNPFPADEFFAMDIGTFCETVIKSREPLLVVNALETTQWKLAPETKVGMISYLGYPVFLPDGRVFGTICVLDDKANAYSDVYQETLLHCRDVLEWDLQALVRLGDELEEQEARLSELFSRVPEAVVMVDSDLSITRINPAFTNIFGYSAQESIGRRIKQLINPVPGKEDFEDHMYRMVKKDDVFAVETVRKHKDGAAVPVSLICVPLPSKGGANFGYLIYRDVTETRRLQEEQRRHREIELELARANRIATFAQLSASIAHELNQPLTGITTNCFTCSRMLTADPADIDGAREAVQRTMRDGLRAASVVERLRALFSKNEPVFEPVDVNETARDVIGLSRDEIQNSRVALRTELANDLPVVRGDRIQLQQVILNLLRNALDAMATVDERRRALLITTTRVEADCVQLSVSDSGVGFDPEAIGRLFEPFYSTKSDGMGMGLSVSRSIIEHHQGRLWAVPNDGTGATFLFSIPSQSHDAAQ